MSEPTLTGRSRDSDRCREPDRLDNLFRLQAPTITSTCLAQTRTDVLARKGSLTRRRRSRPGFIAASGPLAG